MARINRKCRLCRRERAKLFLKGARCFSPKCPIEKDGGTPPGVHGQKSGFRQSSYGKQLREKQKVKRSYGLSETHLKAYFLKAKQEKGNAGERLLIFLESRLDNTLYRLGLVPSRATARQLISHGHILVDGKKITIPSYQISVGQQISLSDKAQKMKKVQAMTKNKEKPPSWLKKKGFIGKIASLPERDDITSEVNESLIVEYYSR